MKILVSNTISAVSLTTGSQLSAIWGVSNVETVQPQQMFIGNATTIVIRATLTEATTVFVMTNWLADSGSYSIDSGGSVALSSTQIEDAYGFSPWGLKTTWRKKPLFISISGSSTIDLTLTTSIDVKAIPLGLGTNPIHSWFQDAGATGRFKDSGSAIVNTSDHGNIFLGGFVTIAGSTYQITKIIGDGTTLGAITLSGVVSTGSITSIKKPVSIGIFRSGNPNDFNNPASVTKLFTQYSTQRFGPNGGYRTILRNVSRNFEVSSFLSTIQADDLIGIANSRRGLPCPIQVLESFTTEKDLLNIYGSINIPLEGYTDMKGKNRSITSNLQEVL